MRSAPQKQPSPNIAMASPSGYGPLSPWPLTKCVRAVGMAVARPGKASSADGISSFLRNENMRRLLIGDPNISVVRWRRTGRGDHVFRNQGSGIRDQE